MTICKFFLNGYCRFGASCRYEHADPHYQGNRQYRESGERGDFRRNDNYHWQKGGGGAANASEAERTAQVIREEIINIENGKMWPLTCYAPIAHIGNLKGWDDYSPEELRFEMWKAYQSNTLNSHEKTIQTLYGSYQEKRRKLKIINRETIDEVREYLASSSDTNSGLSGKTTSVFPSSSSVFGNSGSNQNFSFASALENTSSQSQAAANSFSFSQAFNNQSGSIFGGQTGKPGSVFGGQSSGVFGQSQASQQTSVFGQNQAPQPSVFGQSQAQQPSVFGQNQPASVFGQNQTSGFGQSQSIQQSSVFGQNQNSQHSVFGNPNNTPSPQSVFGNSFVNSNSQSNAQSNSAFRSSNNFSQTNSFQLGINGSVFDQSNFQQNFSSSAPQSQFGNSSNEINQNSAFNTNINAFPSMPSVSSAPSFSVYSPVDTLTKEELNAYEAQTFSFKSIPLNAPSENLCH